MSKKTPTVVEALIDSSSEVTHEATLEVTEEAAPAPEPVSHNPTLIVWPTDIWGLTKDVKAAIIAATSRINGQADKKALLDATLAIALGHLASKYQSDTESRAVQIAKDARDAVVEPTQDTLF